MAERVGNVSGEGALLSKTTWVGGTAEVRTTRKTRWCTARDTYPYPCAGRINKGERYVRSVMFPNHDASGYDVPVARDTCLNCAMNYLHLMDLAIADRRRPTPVTETRESAGSETDHG